MDILDAIKAEVGSYGFTKWEGEIFGHEYVLHAKPITGMEFDRYLAANIGESKTATMIDVIIAKAMDEDEKKIFDKGAKPYLKRLKANKIAEIFNALFGAQLPEDTEEEFEERVKN